MHHGQLNRADLQDLGAQRCHFQHFLEGNAVQPAGLGDDAGIGGVDAVHIRVDIATLGLQRRRQSHGAGIRAAAPQRGNPPGWRMNALEPGHHRHFAVLRERLDHLGAVDILDARRTMRLTGIERHLPALP